MYALQEIWQIKTAGVVLGGKVFSSYDFDAWPSTPLTLLEVFLLHFSGLHLAEEFPELTAMSCGDLD